MSDPSFLKELLDDAIKAHQSGALKEAEDLYYLILNRDPHYVDALILLGMLYAQTGRDEDAEFYLKHAVRVKPDAWRGFHYLGMVYTHQRKVDLAIAAFEKALALNPDTPEIYNHYGNLFRSQDNYPEAIRYYERAIELRFDYQDAYNNLGSTFLRQKNIEKAKETFQKSLTFNDDNVEAHHYLGILAYEEDQLEKALFHFQKILMKQPNKIEALINLAATHLKQGHHDIAKDLFQKVLKQEPFQKEALGNIAAVELILKNHEAAKKYYLDLLTVDPQNYSAHFNLGVIYMGMRRWEDAAFHYEMALSIQPEDADAHSNYATTLIKQGQEALAMMHYEKALSLQPKNPILLYRLASLKQQGGFKVTPKEYVMNLFDHYADYFDKDVVESLAYQVPKMIHERLLKRNKHPYDVLIDLGCGTGLCGELLKPLTHHLIGVDLSSKMLDVAEEKEIYDALYDKDVIEYLNEQKEKVSVLVAADVFCYFGDLQEVFRACYGVLDEKGCLIFTVEELFEMTPGEEPSYRLEKTGRFSHHVDYLIQSLRQVGFQSVECTAVVLRQQKEKNVMGLLVVAEVETV